MNIYQQELLRKLSKFSCTGNYDEAGKRLEVSYDGIPLCSQDEDGYLRYHEDNTLTDDWKATLEDIKEQTAKIREYVRMYATAPQMGISSVSEYRRMAEFGDTVLAGMYSDQHGFMFTTWQQSADRRSVVNGDYSPNFDYVKESFIIRSGLLDKNRLFTEDEAADLYRCIDFAQGNCESLTFEQEQALSALEEKMIYGYPSLEDDPPSFEQADAPQMNM